VAVVSPEHPLAGRDSITLGALRDSPMVALTSSSRQRSNLEAACRAAGFAPQIVAETSDLGVTVELIRQQIGVAILPQSALAGADAVVQLTLTRPKLERRILLAWPTGTSPPAVRAFLALAQHHLAAPDPGARRGRP
jgi:DNA-binding transcriptional LysR family regulator